jgi:hypothetical protein
MRGWPVVVMVCVVGVSCWMGCRVAAVAAWPGAKSKHHLTTTATLVPAAR